MGKTSINVSCLDQRLIVSTAPVIASGGRNEVEVQFAFCPLWEGFQKVASFWRDEGEVFPALIENDACVIPWEVLIDEGEFFFAVFGVKDDITRTSTIVKYKIEKGAITEGTEVSDPTPDMYEQILAACQKVLAGLDYRFAAIDEQLDEMRDSIENITEREHEHDASHITNGIFPIERGGTGASDVETARKNLGAASEDHTHDADDIEGVIPIEHGGTGASTADEARENLGAVSKTGDTLKGEYVFDQSKDGDTIYIRRTFDDPDYETGTYEFRIGLAEDGGLFAIWERPDGESIRIGIDENGVSMSNALAVEEGGTGARDLDTARENLGAAAKSHTHADSDIITPEWIYPELNNGTTPGGVGGQLRYRKIGNHVFVAGSVQVKPPAANSTVVLFQFPEGYRAIANTYKLAPIGGMRVGRLYTNAGGNFILEWAIEIDDGSRYTTENWIDCTFDFWTD